MFTSKQWLSVVLLFLLAGFVLAGCGPEPTEVTITEDEFLVSLPRVVLDVDNDGMPSVAGMDAGTLKDVTLGWVDLTGLRMDPNIVSQFVASGAQHLEVVHRDDGLYVFLNGQPLPHISWTGESLGNTGGLLGSTGLITPELAQTIEMLVPFIQRVGLDVAVRFPLPASAQAMPLREPGALDELMAAPTPETDAESALQLRLDVSYDETGTPHLPGPAFLLENLLGLQLDQLQLPPETIQRLTDMGVQHVTLRTAPNGLLLFANGEALPHLAWNEAGLKTTATLIGQLYGPDNAGLLTTLFETIIPAMSDLDLELTLRFPLAPDAEPIPAPGS